MDRPGACRIFNRRGQLIAEIHCPPDQMLEWPIPPELGEMEIGKILFMPAVRVEVQIPDTSDSNDDADGVGEYSDEGI